MQPDHKLMCVVVPECKRNRSLSKCIQNNLEIEKKFKTPDWFVKLIKADNVKLTSAYKKSPNNSCILYLDAYK